ncbi:two-component response regulator ARR1-like [Papaver somniferum]|uniref:two-component response regulator ARR1-like n=1 Tax=Papaver somniferum TaxID=3469 RepID=UPI000E6FD630|nr:two-component response regulator ARR1-like [Papaver somniferum]
MVTRALENGAGYYLYKPVTYSDFEKLWQHVIKSKVDPKGHEKDMESFCQDSPREKQKTTSRVPVSSSSDYNEGNSRTEVSRKRKEPSRKQPGDGKRTRARSAAPKKRRVIWTVELHSHFLDAIEALGVDNAPTPISLQQNVSQRVPKYSFGSFQPGSEDGNFQGLNTQSHSLHPSASMVAAGFQFGQSSITPMNNNNNKRFMASAQQPRPTTSVAAGNANQEDSITSSPAQSILNMSMVGGRSGRVTMQLVHQQNLMRWRKNIQTTGPLNTSTRTVFESGNFQKQNNNALVANMGTTANTCSSSIGNSAQPSTLSSTNFMGIQIINDNTNFMPTSSVMEVPGMIPELIGLQSSYSAIEEPNSNLDYLNSEPSLVAPTGMSNMIPQPSAEVYFGGGIILNANHGSLAPRYKTRVPTTVPVAPSRLA